MNGTLFDSSYRFMTGSILPSSTGDPALEAFNYTLATNYAINQLRALGLAGSAVTYTYYNSPIALSEISGLAKEYVTLPQGYFGSNNPPLIFVMTQYGSYVYYMQVDDSNGSMGDLPVGAFGVQNPTIRPKFRTYVEELRYSDNRWMFAIVHELQLPISAMSWSFGNERNSLAYSWKTPFKNMLYSYWPTSAFGINTWGQQKTQVILHWYAMGVDPNL